MSGNRDNAAAMRLCDELIQAAYDADICSPGDLAQRVRKIKDAIGPSPLGDVAAMRAALEDIVADCLGCTADCCDTVCAPSLRGCCIAKARAALSAPARNCDIYDAENGAAECMQAIDAAWYEIDTIRATIGWMLASVDTKGADDGI